MKSKRIKKVLISIVVIFLVLSVSYKIYDSKFEGHQARNGVFKYNDYVYKRTYSSRRPIKSGYDVLKL